MKPTAALLKNSGRDKKQTFFYKNFQNSRAPSAKQLGQSPFLLRLYATFKLQV